MSDRLVFLQGGLVVPLEACELVLEMERRGLKLWLDGEDVLIEGRDITPDVVAGVRRWKPHVRLLLAYVASDGHLVDDSSPRPEVGPVLVTRRQAQ